MDKNWFEQEVKKANALEQINNQAPVPYPYMDGPTFLSSFRMRLKQRAREKQKYAGQVPLRNTWIIGWQLAYRGN